MHILIANDDGIGAPGIRALVRAVRNAGHRVTVYAPDAQRSCASHSLSIKKSIHRRRAECENAEAYAVDGSPADCVRLALFLMRDDRPDFVLCGINKGSNLGAAILYSGTVGAAAEAALAGIPAMAVSLRNEAPGPYTVEDYRTAADTAVRVTDWAAEHPLPFGEIYNLNVPYGQPVRGFRTASLSNDYIMDIQYDVIADEEYYFRDQPNILEETKEDSDLLLVDGGWATLSVLTWSLESGRNTIDLSGLEEDRNGRP